MSEMYGGKTVNYCYHCGNRVIKKTENCWYCGVPTTREIRPVKRCPFCAEPVRPDAIKCKHCGEFLDGRPQLQPQPVQQMIVIGKESLQSMSDLQLLPGRPVPESARNLLDEKTVRAIEENRPEDIDRPDIRLLPAPETLDVEFESETGDAPLARRESGAEPKKPTERKLPMMPVDSGSKPPAVTKRKLPLAPAGEGQPLAKSKKGMLAPIEGGGGKAPAGGAAEFDAEIAATYRNCANCGTEILAVDNFCYHCGTQYRKTQADELHASREFKRKVAKFFKVLIVLAILGGAAYGGWLFIKSKYSPEEIEDATGKVLGGAKGAIERGMQTLSGTREAAAQAEQCRANLLAIQKAKQAAAARRNRTSGPIPVEQVLAEMGATEMPACPAGGNYLLNEIQQLPTCSIGDNGTPKKDDDHIIAPPE